MKNKLIDLHTHTTASDGSMTPAQLVRHAAASGLSAIAITDHDTMEGIEEAYNEGIRCGIEVLPAVEISVDFKPEMHMLGYFSKESFSAFGEVLEKLRKSREERNPKIAAKLKELGFDISMQEVEELANGNIVARPHFAGVLMQKGYVSSISEAFEKYLASGRPAYFKKDKLTPEEGIQEILSAGGIPVLAHPIFLQLNWRQLDKLVGDLKKSGLMGIEAYYSENTSSDTGNLLRLAIKHNLIPTGGSDFHGAFKMGLAIGVGRGRLKVPYECLERLKSSLGIV